MILLSGLALAGELALPTWSAGGWTLQGGGALATRALVWVGDESDITRQDLAATEGVSVGPVALEAELGSISGLYGALRVEEGTVHAGALEAAEARLGFERPAGGLWIGRADLPFSRDREMEAEDLALSWRPVLSRAALPLHASGAGAALAWPERARLEAGLSWTSASSDAAWRWGRLSITPVGPLPDRQEDHAEHLRLGLGVGAARLASPSLGTSTLGTADLELRWRGALLGGGAGRWWDDGEVIDAAWGELGGHIATLGPVGLRLHGRVERVVALEDDEDARWIGAARLGAWVLDDALEIFAEVGLSRERGSAVAPGEDVVDLGRGIERANDVAALGARLRF